MVCQLFRSTNYIFVLRSIRWFMASRESEFSVLYLFFDLILINISIAVVFSLSPSFWEVNRDQISIYFLHGNFACTITNLLSAHRNIQYHQYFWVRLKRIAKRTLLFMLLLGASAVFILPIQFSIHILLAYSGVFFVGRVFMSLVIYLYLRHKQKKGYFVNRAVIIGYNNTGKNLRKLLESNLLMGYSFVGYLDNQNVQDDDIIGNPEQLESIIDTHNIHMVFVTVSIYDKEGRVEEFLKICNHKGIRIRLAPMNQLGLKASTIFRPISQEIFINPQEIPLDRLDFRIYKRVFDVVFSLLTVVLLLTWLLPLLALIIKTTSKGPVFVTHIRTGINNKIFRCIKLRTTYKRCKSDVDDSCEDDAPVTIIGGFLQLTNLDELPQFFNVLMGHMSVVGPRPHRLKFTDEYTALIPNYLVRNYVKPGITGWAQVNGSRGQTDKLWMMQKRVDYDMEYIENWNFWWDIRIIAQTLSLFMH